VYRCAYISIDNKKCSGAAVGKCVKCSIPFCAKHLHQKHDDCDKPSSDDEGDDEMELDEPTVEEYKRLEKDREDKDRRERQCSHSDCTDDADLFTACKGCGLFFCENGNHLYDHSCLHNLSPLSGQLKLSFTTIASQIRGK